MAAGRHTARHTALVRASSHGTLLSNVRAGGDASLRMAGACKCPLCLYPALTDTPVTSGVSAHGHWARYIWDTPSCELLGASAYPIAITTAPLDACAPTCAGDVKVRDGIAYSVVKRAEYILGPLLRC